MQLFEFTPGPTHPVEGFWKECNVFIKRLDCIDSWASGNKYYKLLYNLQEAIQQRTERIVSKGGMFSNHLEALAVACHHFQIPFTAVIRSYQPDDFNPSIRTLNELGADTIYLHPAEYTAFDQVTCQNIYPGSCFIPEGGANALGIKGASDLMTECMIDQPDRIILAGGTLSTFAGLLKDAPEKTHVTVVPAWKGCTKDYASSILEKFDVSPRCTWDLWPDFHFGGFGKTTTTLMEFMTAFTTSTHIPLDPVYTGKLMFAINEKLKTDGQLSDQKILIIHTGGLSGINGYAYRDPVRWREYKELVGGIGGG